MPVNDKYPIESVLEACVHYINKTKRRISFEWALVSGVTDTYSVACDLGSMLKGMLCHVNLIPLNPTKEFKGEPSTRGTAEIFVKTLVFIKTNNLISCSERVACATGIVWRQSNDPSAQRSK